MMKILCTLKKYMSCPPALFTAMAGISALSLACAFIAQYVFGLEPCIMCIYQRIPFAIAILVAGGGLMMRKMHISNIYHAWVLSIVFGINGVLAFYHSGVERHWWKSVFEGCAVPDLGTDPAKLLETILNAPTVRCDEIPWADPLLGLSMANYNVLLCAGLAMTCAVAAMFIKQRKPS